MVLAASLAGPLAAQQPPQVTADDYARAEGFLGATTSQLVTGMASAPTWLPDGRFWYRVTVADGNAFIVVDPTRRTRAEAFDRARLADALGAALGRRFEPGRLPFRTFDMAADGRSIAVTALGRSVSCDLERYTCTVSRETDLPPNSSVSPDGRWAAFIRNNNLWATECRCRRRLSSSPCAAPAPRRG